MNEVVIKEDKNINDKIYIIRGQQVMLDFDLAELYECTNGTKDINKAVKRNIDRFDQDMYFQLNENDLQDFWFQFGTKKTNVETRGGRFKHPYAFTEAGVGMLSGILHTSKAIETSKAIMKAFVLMKNYISTSLLEQKYINNLVLEDNEKIKKNANDIKLLQETFNSFKSDREINEIYFEGKIYDAYSKILDIFNEATKELIIIDRYTDKTILDMIKNLKCKVILITGKNSKLTKLDISKYSETYDNLTIYYDDTYHDRYFIIDKDKIYHSGNSVNHIGYRKSSINVLEDEKVKRTIIGDIEKIISSKT